MGSEVLARESGCTCTHDLPSEAPGPLVVLVHGTFAQHALWVRTDEPIADAIRSAGGVPVTFCWSGRNRHRDRLDAGDALRSLLSTLVALHPNSPVRIVAHSHGGNVALYALGHENPMGGRHPGGFASGESPSVVDPLASVKVTTLATPFVNARVRDLGHRVRQIVLVGEVLLGVFGAGSLTGAILGEWFEPSSPASWLGLAMSFAMIYLALLRPISARAFRRQRPDIANVWQLVTDPLEAHPLRLKAMIPTGGRLVAIRGVGDEAGAALGASQLMGWVWSIVARRSHLGNLRTILLGISGLAAAVAITLGLFVGESMAADGFADAFATGLGWFVVSMIWLTPVLVTAMHLTAVPFGIDGLFLTPVVALTAESTPVGVVTLHHVEAVSDHGLVHSIYEHPAVVETITAQVRRDASCTG